ncbi:MAG TPA: UDP-N-acetylmuramoyl-tripeptide--D-alanyl-D-alanine ligase [Candidatus Paceibacterota bacterium]|nr:UDP-N-acetylmuramoyl-tripeptide--D-alanyl-D-alanine ligase [Candidatus Paceibacterota bacterium]
MKSLFTSILRWKLKKLAQFMVLRYRPGIVGVTGSAGKTSTKLAIAAVLGPSRRTRFSRGNLNSELGLPLAIIGDFTDDEINLVSHGTPPGTKRFRKAFFWIKVIMTGVFNLIRRKKDYPEILVLEYGADKPGDLRKLIEIARPNIAIITAIGDIPVHVEFFSGPEDVAREKAKLIEQLPSAGFAVLNYDDDAVLELKDRTRAHVITFGFQKGAELRLVNFENRIENGKAAGVSFKMEYGGSSIPVKIDDVFGKVQAYAAGAAAAVGLIFGINMVKIAEALKAYRPAPGRMTLFPGVKGTMVIDSSYNASPLAMHAALDTLRDLPGKRKVAVLGDMRELGEYMMEAHERVGRIASQFVNVLVTVGPAGKLIAEAAKKHGLPKRNIQSFDTADEAVDAVEGIIKKGDLILVKGSHSMELDKVAEAIRAV